MSSIFEFGNILNNYNDFTETGFLKKWGFYKSRGKEYKNRKDWIVARMNRFLCK